jgi:hypothetical protein
MRPLPHVENLALFPQEESEEEAEARLELNAATSDIPTIPDVDASTAIMAQTIDSAPTHVPQLPLMNESSVTVAPRSAFPALSTTYVAPNTRTDAEKAVVEHGRVPPVPPSTAPPASTTSLQDSASYTAPSASVPVSIPSISQFHTKDVQMDSDETPAVARSFTRVAPIMEEDEEIPAIDMGSDSDNEST